MCNKKKSDTIKICRQGQGKKNNGANMTQRKTEITEAKIRKKMKTINKIKEDI